MLGGLSRAEFCRRTGVHETNLGNWAHGIRPRRGTICQIAVGLGRPVSEIQDILNRIVADGRVEPEPDYSEPELDEGA